MASRMDEAQLAVPTGAEIQPIPLHRRTTPPRCRRPNRPPITHKFSPGTEKGHVVGGGLDAQHDAGLVVHLDRALAEAVLDAGALDAGGELRTDLLGQLRRDLPAEEA